MVVREPAVKTETIYSRPVQRSTLISVMPGCAPSTPKSTTI